MNESNLQKHILLLASNLGHRLFRHNVGVGWVGKSVRISTNVMVQCFPGDVVIRQARPLHAGLVEGGSDLLGFSKNGLFMAVETKVEGNYTDKERLEKQINFIDNVNNAGGVAGICKNIEDAKIILASSRII